MMIFPSYYMFEVKNETGGNLSSGNCYIDALRYNFGTDGAIAYESSYARVLVNNSTLNNGSYSAGEKQDNTTNKYIGGTFSLTVTPSSSPDGNIIVYYHRGLAATSGYDTDGKADIVCVLPISTTGTFTKTFQL